MAENEAQPRVMSEGVKAHFKIAADNIIFLKRQQWTITNHALVLYAALTALAKDTTDIERSILTFLGLVGCIFSLLCIGHTQQSMTRYYQNLYDIHSKYFTDTERDDLELLRSRPTFNRNPMFVWGLLAVNFIAFWVAFYFIWVKGGIPVLHGVSPKGA
jgi:hypothetical protein